MSNIYSVYIKSHCEYPDYEAEFTAHDLKPLKCLVPYADDIDPCGYPNAFNCEGKLKKTKYGFKCLTCGVEYIRS